MHSHSASARLFPGLICVLVATGALLAAAAQEVPSATASTTALTHPTSAITNVLFHIQGTPLMSRVQEITGIVYPEDLEPQPAKRARGKDILPGVDSPPSTATTVSGPLFVPPTTLNPVSSYTLLTRPLSSTGTLELRFLLKLKGITREPSQLFLNAKTGLLMVRGTAQETELIRDLIQNPPTNAVAYLKSRSNGLTQTAP